MSTAPIKSNNPPSTDSPDWAFIQTKVRKHLVWKEGRILLPACVSLLALVALGMIARGMTSSESLSGNASSFITLALGGATMAALVCGSVTFSLERENQTDEFLARLPLSGKKLARVKIATSALYFLVSYVIALVMAIGLFALFFNGRSLLHLLGSRAVLGPTAPIAFLMPVVCLLWSMMFSRYLKTTLSTVLFAAVSTILIPAVLSGVSEAITYWSGMSQRLQPWLFSGLFFTQMVVLVYAIGRQHGSWLRPSSIADPNAVAGTTEAPVQLTNTKISFATSMRVLLWQTFRFHWLGSMIALLVCGLYLVATLSVLNTALAQGAYEAVSLSTEVVNDFFAALIGGATGLFLFSKDQAGHSFRFFQQRADYPRRIWLARIINLVAIGLVVSLTVFIINLALYSTLVAISQSYQLAHNASYNYSSAGSFNFDSPIKLTEWSYYFSLTLRSATMYFVVAAVGLLVSIFCRHGILNALFGIVFCSMAAIWVRYVNWYQVPTWSLAWPIGIAAFAMSWAYAPSWIRGTRQFSWSLVSTLVMIGVIGACIFGMRQDRLNDYPIQPAFADLDQLYEHPEKLKANGDPRFEVARELNDAVSQIELAWSKIIDEGEGSKKIPDTPRKFTKAELSLAEDEEDAFAKVATLVQDPTVRYYFSKSPDAANEIPIYKKVTIKKCLKLNEAVARESGEPERIGTALFAELAFEVQNGFFYYPSELADLLKWADSDAKTSAEILPLIDQVESLIQSKFSPNNMAWLESTYTRFRTEQGSGKWQRQNFLSSTDLPWEYERTKRKYQHKLLNDWNQDQRNREKEFASTTVINLRHVGASLKRADAQKAPLRNTFDFQYTSRAKQDLSIKNWLRYAQVRLALAAWRLDHQEYPKKLKELSLDYLGATFPTVYLTDAFSYHPNGLGLPVVLSTPDVFERSFSGRAVAVKSVIPAKTPFLLPWTALPTEQRYFQLKIPDEQDKTEFSTTAPVLGYFMGQQRTNNNQSYLNNNYPELYVLGDTVLVDTELDD